MRQLACICFVVCAHLSDSACANDQFPYTAEIKDQSAEVRSGPGRVHYATARLDQGEKVEVWRHDPGGWCAIRPPHGSFSLVPLRRLRVGETDEIAEVASENVTAWVGSQLGEVDEPLWQVRLERGERVQLLGTTKMADSVAGVSHIVAKIAPPAGEFRWVHIRHLQRIDQVGPVQETAATPQPRGWTQRAETRPSSNTKRISLTSLVTRTARISDDPRPTVQADLPSTHLQATDDSFQAQLDQLDVQLSLMVSNPPKTWKLDELRQQATKLVGSSSTDYQRGQARLIVDRINAFDDVRARLENGDAVMVNYLKQNSTDKLPATDATGTNEIGTGVQPASFSVSANSGTRFDGSGWLIPIHSGKSDVPKYALADERGQVKKYVTPAPGMNLHRYLQKEVGVFGKQGLLQKLRTEHVTVNRVVLLDRHR